LYDQGGHGGDHGKKKNEKDVSSSPFIVATAENRTPAGHGGDEADSAREGRGNGADEDISMAYV
jgi:hypothetical protein